MRSPVFIKHPSMFGKFAYQTVKPVYVSLHYVKVKIFPNKKKVKAIIHLASPVALCAKLALLRQGSNLYQKYYGQVHKGLVLKKKVLHFKRC